MKNEKYNGWSNYETWCTKLWLDNDSYDYWQDETRIALRDAKKTEYWSARDSAVCALASSLKSHHDEVSADAIPNACLFSDLLQSALADVNWSEIAHSLIESVEN